MAAPSVTSYLMGGCANQIFQYATGLALARRLGVDLQLNVSWYETATPNTPRLYSLGLFKGVDSRVVHSLLGKVIRQDGFLYQPEQFENAPRKCSIVGYWQCEKYFFTLRNELLCRLLPKQALLPFHCDMERQVAQAGNRSAFMHVRRTDYIGNPYHVVLPMDYYREAAALIAAKVQDPVFFIFSDEPGWCRANLHLPYPTVIAESSNDGHQSREDAGLWLMRQCCHAIIANSSFSWWGAWLGADMNGGIVIAPKSWFGPACKDDPRDIVPSRWIRL